MITNIILITKLAAFTLIGLCMHFNKTARRTYALITSMGLTAILLPIFMQILLSWTWYQKMGNILPNAELLTIISYWVLLVIGSLVFSLILNPIYKLIDLGVASISKPTARICGGLFALANGFILIMVVTQALGMCGVNVPLGVFQEAGNLMLIK